jgi:hypothetical protein
MLFLGIDWGEAHHDLCLLDQDGRVLAARRVVDGLAGVEELHTLVAAQAEQPGQVAVGIETDRGLLVGALLAAGYQVYAVNPRVVGRYRGRHRAARAKSDRGMPRCWLIWSAPTGTTTARSRVTARRPGRLAGHGDGGLSRGAAGCNPPAMLATWMARGPVVPVGQACPRVKGRPTADP